MRRALTKFASNLFGKKQQAKSTVIMSPSRYFQNKLDDYEEGKTTVEVPTTHLLAEVNTMIENITTNLKPVELNAEDGVYLGTAGVGFMFYRLSKNATFLDQRNSFLEEAVEYIESALAVAQKYAAKKSDVASLLLGNCGIYAVAAAIYNASGNTERCDYFRQLYYDAADTCKDIKFLKCGSDEFFVGRAGYVGGALWLAQETNTKPKLDDLFEICRVMVASGREYAHKHNSSTPLMYAYYGVEYLGAAHGLCSILQTLMMVPGYLAANPDDERDVKKSVDYLLSLQDAEGNFPSALDEINENFELLHWCHGAPGMIYLMARAYLVWREDKYFNACKKMTDLIWTKGLLKKGPGICHGIAGSGYAFLLLYRLTSHPKYLHRAVSFAGFMESEEFKRHSRVPDHPFSLYEGITGTVCFLADLLEPSQAVFPFSDVF